MPPPTTPTLSRLQLVPVDRMLLAESVSECCSRMLGILWHVLEIHLERSSDQVLYFVCSSWPPRTAVLCAGRRPVHYPQRAW
jgi:hypothetical protein